MKTITSTINIQNKKYSYTLEQRKNGVFVTCPDANISQLFDAEDVPALIFDLPNLIIAEKEYADKAEVIRFRVDKETKKRIESIATQKGFASVSAYLRTLALA